MRQGDLPYLPPQPVAFPAPEQAWERPDGLLAAGGDLTCEWLLEAYARGIFPWFDDDSGPVLWWSPSERGVLIPGTMKVSRSLRKKLRQDNLRIGFDQAFPQVIAACAETRSTRVGTWITPSMQAAYIAVHEAGFAHSVEVFEDEKLVGGLYGLSLGSMFFGESMFSISNDASKIAFYHLSQRLAEWRFDLIDCQLMNPHLESLGVRPMARAEFLARLRENDLSRTRLGSWDRSAAF